MSISFNHLRTDYYVTLEVTPLSSYDEIHKSYRALSKKYHPDIFPDKEVAEEKMREIVEAFNQLKEPESRKYYDSRRMYQVRPYNRARSKYMEKKPSFFEKLFGKKDKQPVKTMGGKDPVEGVFSMAVPLVKTRKIDSVELAHNEFVSLLKTDGKNPDLHYNLGITSYYLGNYSDASIYFSNAHKLDPDFEHARLMIGLIAAGAEREKQQAEEEQTQETA